MQKSVLNKQGKFGVKISWRYTDMVIFVLRCFILTHPVYVPKIMKICTGNPQQIKVMEFGLMDAKDLLRSYHPSVLRQLFAHLKNAAGGLDFFCARLNRQLPSANGYSLMEAFFLAEL